MCTTETDSPRCNAARGGPPEKHPFINTGVTLTGTVCAFGCFVLSGGQSGFHARIGFGPAAYAGVGLSSSRPPDCGEADQFFADYGPFGASVQRPKDPNAPYNEQYGDWEPSASVGYGVKFGGGFAHWWNL